MLAICNTVVVTSQQANHGNGASSSSDNGEGASGNNVDGATNKMYSNGRKETKQDSSQPELQFPGAESPKTYEAESPDEAALVKSAGTYGYKLLSRGPDSITIEVPGEGVVKYHLLHTLIFDSIRKRMSVIVRRENDNKIIMYCKGADTAVIPQLSKDSKAKTLKHHDTVDALDGKADEETEDISLVEITETHLNVYAREGLRTLCMARKVTPM